MQALELQPSLYRTAKSHLFSVHSFKKTVMLSEAGLLVDTADSFEDLSLPLSFMGGISILCFVLLGYDGQPEPTTTTRTQPIREDTLIGKSSKKRGHG